MKVQEALAEGKIHLFPYHTAAVLIDSLCRGVNVHYKDAAWNPEAFGEVVPTDTPKCEDCCCLHKVSTLIGRAE